MTAPAQKDGAGAGAAGALTEAIAAAEAELRYADNEPLDDDMIVAITAGQMRAIIAAAHAPDQEGSGAGELTWSEREQLLECLSNAEELLRTGKPATRRAMAGLLGAHRRRLSTALAAHHPDAGAVEALAAVRDAARAAVAISPRMDPETNIGLFIRLDLVRALAARPDDGDVQGAGS